MTTPKLPLTRHPASNGHLWRQADGSLFSFAEHEEWVWQRLARADEADALEAKLDEMENEAWNAGVERDLNT